MSHQLESLGPERFQQLCQALLIREYKDVVCYPVGQPDGGRDAVVRLFTEPEGQFIVFQVKFARDAATGKDIRDWVIKAATGEAAKAQRLKNRGATKYVFITNVPGTSHLDSGSMDVLQKELENLLGLPVVCWWRDDIDRRLDGSWDIKLRYPEVLSGQDFLRLLIESTDKDNHVRRLNAIRAFLSHQFQEDQEVKFKQVELQNKLLDLFVDLPFSIRIHSSPERMALKPFSSSKFTVKNIGGENIFEIGNHGEEDDETGTATLLLSEVANEFLGQIVVEGAPGQGKSTLAQYLCQVHRIRLLNKKEELAILPVEHRLSPVCIPIKIDLRDLSEWLSGNDPFIANSQPPKESTERTLETFLARLIEHGAGGVNFSVNDLIELAKVTPIFIALDGLDEVADIKRRADVVSAVSKAVPRLRENCGGLRVMVTSRPAAFANSPGFDSKQFPYLQLGSVTRIQIAKYAGKWLDARALTSKERREFESVLNTKLDQPHLRDLSRNPMQLTILLSLIHTRGAALPDKRTTLYDAYVDLFFSRESTKNAVVREHLDLLKDIHRHLAWILHSAAESGRGTASDGRVTSAELRNVLSQYLMDEGQSTVVIDQVFNAMLERVVMIVSRIEGTYEFEVQPLREYFAARYLYDTASYSPTGREKSGTKPDRFDAIARNPYWLNVVRFFCGCFSKGELLDLADRVTTLTKDSSLGRTKQPFITCAMLLSDWVFSQSPKAVAEVSVALSSRNALRKLIPTDRYYRSDDPIRIPDSCGGRDIRDKAYDFLFDLTIPMDVGQGLARFISANASRDESAERWLQAFPSDADRIYRWLAAGRALNCLHESTSQQLYRMIGDYKLSSSAVGLLADAGLVDCAVKTPENGETVSRHFLMNLSYQGLDATIKSPFYLLPYLFSFIGLWGLHRISDELRDQLVIRMVDFGKRQFVPNHSHYGNLLGLSEKCYIVSHSIAARLNPDMKPRESTTFWESAVDDCASMIGEYPVVVAVAIAVTSLPREKKGRLPKRALLNHDESFSERIRFAKAQSKRWDWWEIQFQEATTSLQRSLVHLTFWAWCPVAMVLEHAQELSLHLDALPKDEWDDLLPLIQLIVHNVSELRSTQRKATKLPNIGRSSRLAILIAIKDPQAYGQSIFLSHFVESTDEQSTIIQFRLSNAIGATGNGDLSWRSALDIAKFAYKHGVFIVGRNPKPMPTSAIDEVLEHPQDYPAMLWEQAQNSAAAEGRKKIRQVGQIAKRDRWFPT